MQWFQRWRDRRGMEQRLERELRDHVALEAEDQGGDSYAARRVLGNQALIKEDTRAEWGGLWLDRLSQDLRFAGRSMRRRPAFFAAAVLIVGVGIGINTAVFTVVRNVMLDPLPFPDADELVVIWKESPTAGSTRTGVAPGDFLELRERLRFAAELTAYFPRELDASAVPDPYRVTAAVISANLLRTLGAQPIIGRDFVPGDERPDAPRVAILSHRLWQERFGGTRDVVGTRLVLNAEAFTVVGVLDPGFQFPQLFGSGPNFDVWLSLPQDARWRAQRGPSYVTMLARLRPDVELAGARAEMALLSKQFAKDQPSVFGGKVMTLTPLHEQVVGNVRPLLLVLWAAVTCILLSACANLANLLMVAATARQREMAVRAALGAGRSRLMRQLLTESVALAVAGGLLGAGLALAMIRVLPAIGLTDIPRLHEVSMDLRVLGFALVLAVATGLLFGTVPAWRSSATNPGGQLRDTSRTTDGRQTRVIRSGLVIVQVSSALMLLVGAGLLIRSFTALLRADRPFQTDSVLTFDLSLPRAKYESARAPAYFDEVLTRIRSLPQVVDAGAVNVLPLAGARFGWTYMIENRPITGGGPIPSADFGIATPGFFSSLGVPIVTGREFEARDTAQSQPVAIINETFARLNWPDEDPIGRRFRRQGSVPWVTVVGMVSDLPYAGIDQPPPPTFYEPLAQVNERSMTIVVRTSGDPLTIARPTRNAVREIDPDVLLLNVRPMRTLISDNLRERRLLMAVLATFAGLALFLATFGIYSVISYGVTQRTREIGVRLALGAQRSDIAGLVLRHGATLASGGVVTGLLGAFLLSDVIAGFLYGVEPTDTLTMAGVSGILFSVALLASYVPARRATRVDPLMVLRSD